MKIAIGIVKNKEGTKDIVSSKDFRDMNRTDAAVVLAELEIVKQQITARYMRLKE